MNSIADVWAFFMLDRTLASTLLFILVSLIVFLFRKSISPQWAYALFLLIFVKLTIPYQCVGLFSWNEVPVSQAPPISFSYAPIHTDIEFVDEREATVESEPPTPIAPPEPIEVNAQPFKIPQLSVTGVLFAVWIIAVCVMLLRLAYCHRKVRRTIRNTQPFYPSALPFNFPELCREIGVKRTVALRTVKEIQSPFATGWLRPSIILPKNFCESYGEDEIRWILMHELSHIRRWDPPVKYLQNLIRIVFFFHPAVWLTNLFLDRFREFACDEEAVRRMPDSRGACGESFLRMVVANNRPVPALPGTVTLFHSQNQIKERLMRILNQRPKPKKRHRALFTLLFVLLALFSITVGGISLQAQNDNPKSVQSDSTQNEPPIETKQPEEEKNRSNQEAYVLTKEHDLSTDTSTHIATGATETSDPDVYRIRRPMYAPTLQVGIINTGSPLDEINWLKFGLDYIYDDDTGQITFLDGELSYKPKPGDRIHVEGVYRQDILPIDAWMDNDAVLIRLNGETLQEGSDYTIDRSLGCVRISRPEVNDKRSRLFAEIGDRFYLDKTTEKAKGRLLRPMPTRQNPNAIPIQEARDYDPELFKRPLTSSNLIATDDPFVYRTSKLYHAKRLLLGISNRIKGFGEERWLQQNRDYTYDDECGLVRLLGDEIPFDPSNGESISIMGNVRQDFIVFRGILQPGDVTVELNGERLTEGSDYTVDYRTSTVRVLRDEINSDDAIYKVSGIGEEYVDWRTERARRVEKAAARKKNLTSHLRHDMVSAFPTENPRIYHLNHPVLSRNVECAIASTNKDKKIQWIKPHRDFSFDGENGVITFHEDFELQEDEFLYVYGYTEKYNVFLYHRPLKKEEVKITSKGNPLLEGSDYQIDCDRGIITILNTNLMNEPFAISIGDDAITVGRKINISCYPSINRKIKDSIQLYHDLKNSNKNPIHPTQ